MARWFKIGLPVSAPFVRRCLKNRSVLRFHVPLVEPDVRSYRIRLSDKASCVRPRNVARLHFQTGQFPHYLFRGLLSVHSR